VRTLIIFVKGPEPGAVKTRLVPLLGARGAAELYRLLAEAELRATAPVADDYQRLVFFTPETARDRVAQWLPGEVLVPQAAGDLGARMSSAFAEAFARGAERVALVGSDVPWVTRELVVEALEALDTHDLAIGPALDGGYYLLALPRPQPELFEGIAWSSAGVLEATVCRAATLRLSVHHLAPLPDIDTPDDLHREWGRIEPLLAGTALGRELAALVTRPRSS
jgi:rSAM/selenodomain-associated transferase 1